MCGRFALYTEPERIAWILDARLGAEVPTTEAEGWRPRWNVGPAQQALVVMAERSGGGEAEHRIIHQQRWGLVPYNAKSLRGLKPWFNARAETIEKTWPFSIPFHRHQRLLVVADGFFEPYKEPGAPKSKAGRPYYFARTDGQLVTFAGLWERWHDPDADEDSPPLYTCTIVTTDPSPDVADIHNRMPVIVEADQRDIWLDPENDDTEELKGIMRPSGPGLLLRHAVDPRANNIRNDDPEIIQPYTEPSVSAALPGF